ncbi:hypothetical protein [Fodinibius sediminis]|uniref:Ribbon-helix-helix protein, copG family n=1 Tax=Fodinibius sediminis TaxID=1214077 RepID=A0A521FD39_9BACT|nr:hypothetical protein [Fodinibius sediminis]SMO94128.1 hypothetical protein SAMN06265218_13010 [Fodinibius sediminis]
MRKKRGLSPEKAGQEETVAPITMTLNLRRLLHNCSRLTGHSVSDIIREGTALYMTRWHSQQPRPEEEPENMDAVVFRPASHLSRQAPGPS